MQLYVQQLNSALEDTSQQVLAGMPKIMKDAQVCYSNTALTYYFLLLILTQNLQNEAFSLRSKMSEVQNDITDVQRETGSCMENLERLDCLKTKLQVNIRKEIIFCVVKYKSVFKLIYSNLNLP